MNEREEKALETVRYYMWWSLGAGLVPLPWLDLVAVAGVQLKMLSTISHIYGVEFQANRGKAVIATLSGFVMSHVMSFGVLGSLLKSVPLVGVLAGAPAMAMFSAASAYAVGKVFIQHFESGGTFLNFDPEQVRAYYQAQFEEGRKVAANMGTHPKAEGHGASADAPRDTPA